MNTLDLILLVPIVLGFVFGLFKGLIKELASLAAIVLGIYGAKMLAPAMSTLLIQHFHFSTKTALPFAYLVLFAAIAIVLLLLAKTLDKIFDSIALSGLNKFLGGLFSALKYALIISVLLNVFDALDTKFTFIKPKTKMESIGYKPLLKFAPALWDEAKTIKTPDSKEHSSHEENKSNKKQY
jgi:membrane protein required for colicin V production